MFPTVPSIGSRIAAACTALVIAQSTGFAAVKYDIRATALGGVQLPASFGKGGFPLTVGDTITFTVYAQVTGASGNLGSEGFQSGWYSLLSSTTAGGTLGTFLNGTVLPSFATGAFNGGTPSDTNGDGMNDRLGGQRTVSSNSVAPFDVTVRFGSTPNYNGTPITDGMEYALSTADFQILTLGDLLSVNVAPSIFLSGISAARFSSQWAEDTAGGVTPQNRLGGFQTLAPTAPNTGEVQVGAPVSISIVPEPTAFGMVLVGAMGLVAARRRGAATSRSSW